MVDNPPFSIISKICSTFNKNDIRFFLFAPYLTNFSSQTTGICHVITDVSIIYQNGAEIATSFLTNMDEYEIRTAPKLARALQEANKSNKRQIRKQVPKYSYPEEVLTATMMGYIGRYGIELKISHEDCEFVRALESQKKVGKGIFGSGYLLSRQKAAEKAAAEKIAAEKAAAEKAIAHRWPLSKKEEQIIDRLSEKHETK